MEKRVVRTIQRVIPAPQKKISDSSQALKDGKLEVTSDGREEEETHRAKDSSRPHTSLWRDASFYDIKFTESLLPFPEDFPFNCQSLHSKSSLELPKMDETHLY